MEIKLKNRKYKIIAVTISSILLIAYSIGLNFLPNYTDSFSLLLRPHNAEIFRIDDFIDKYKHVETIKKSDFIELFELRKQSSISARIYIQSLEETHASYAELLVALLFIHLVLLVGFVSVKKT
ncbi:MAG: sulfatase maturation enzyme AslB (radical SAM superfamily) [Enterobacterales bacterium]|jgi:sulfatase maturation enzyme AslB (radical SAM superfamily)